MFLPPVFTDLVVPLGANAGMMFGRKMKTGPLFRSTTVYCGKRTRRRAAWG
jgi:hypothetical protein